MCGILAILNSKDTVECVRIKALELSKKMRHRGPDWNGVFVYQTDNGLVNALAHERLAIVDLDRGAQPLLTLDQTVALCVNGEIYNSDKIRGKYSDYKFTTKSDCECIIPLYLEHGFDFVDQLDGIFGFVLCDTKNNQFIAARDAIGVCSMYMGWHHNGSVWFASEIKPLVDECTLIQEFPPGHYWSSAGNTLVRWYQPVWVSEHYLPQGGVDYQLLRRTLEESVVKRLMADVPFGVLLSGGLDSSLVASIVAGYLSQQQKMLSAKTNGVQGSKSSSPFMGPMLHTFSIGLENSPDLKWAQKVADYLDTRHHSFTFTIQEGLDALRDVITYIETYDVTTVRASTPMFLMARRIKAMGVKMVMSGEGSDEIFGGYLYFHKAPSAEEFHRELVRKIKLLSKYDCLRANKSTYAWGLEARVPFLDKQFLNVAMQIDAKHKMIDAQHMEKYIIRKAFDVINESTGRPYLPDDVLWRQKEQFSDGVGYSWIDALKDHAERAVSDEQFSKAAIIFPYNAPATKEAYLYRTIFDSSFPKESCAKTVPFGPSIACSTAAAIQWDAAWAKASDPSGRAIAGVHTAAYAAK